MYYAKSNPIETIEEHTNKLLENMKLLKELYGVQILNEAKFDKERFWILLEIICTYHDLGKVYTPFQNIIRKQLNEPLLTTEFNYEFVKHEQLSPIFVPIQKYNLTKDEKKLVYQSIYYHHEREGKDINNIYVQEIIEKDIMLQLEKIKNEVPYELPGNINCMYIKYIQNRNRIKQNDELFIEYCLLKGILHRLDHSSSAEMYVEDSTLENIANYVQDFMKKRKYIKNDLQEYCTENSNDNLLVIGSTGMGKTESALFWSNGEKTFFTLPIRTSINAIYDRINESIGYQHIGLLHSTALDYLEEKDEFGNQEEIYRQSQNLSQKITACTIDQIFPFVFKYKGYEKMYATLSYSKLIIDEIQAYSPEIVAIIIKGLEMIYKIGGKFMIMTATLPQIYKNELEKMGIHFQFNKFIKATKRHKIKLEEKDILDDLKDLIEKSKKSKVLIITNTVNKAIDIFLELQELKVENINLLHSRFIYNDRSAKEFKIKKFSENRKENGIWITTQIVEASLDIDFDYLYTEMSTLDSLFQRLGRCYRSREYDGQDANVHIYIENMSGIKYIYDEEINKISIDLLKKYDGMMLDENTKVNLVDKLYSEDMLKNSKFLKRFKSGINILDNIIDYQTGKKEAQKLLRNIENVNIIPKQIYEENLKLFEYYAKEVNYKERNRIKREIDKLTISISQSQQRKLLDRLTKNPYIKELLIADLKYDDNIGLLLKKDEEYEENEKFL